MSDLLARLADSVTRSNGLESLTRPLLELLESITGLESTYLTTIDLAQGRQRVRFARNAGELQIPEGIEVPWEDTLCRRALEGGSCAVDDVPERWGDSDAARALGITSYVTTPVRAADGELLGTLCAASSRRRAVDAEARKVLELFARLIAQQIEREALLSRLQAANEELAAHASTDALTGLPNRRAVRELLASRLRHANVQGRRLHLGFVDLDGFKRINDQHGHAAGDRFLQAMAGRLAGVLRQGDVVARYGGDEFVVLFDTPADHGAAELHLAERLEAASQGRFDLGDLVLDYPGASVGVVSSLPGEADVDALIARADAAMYARKQARRNTG